MSDVFEAQAVGLSAPLVGAFAILPNDSVDLAQVTRQIRVTGASGNLSATWKDGTTVTLPVFAGDVLDWRLVRVQATGTTATGLWGFY